MAAMAWPLAAPAATMVGHRVGLVEPYLLAPHILADGDAEVQSFDPVQLGGLARLEIPGFVKDIVGRQQLLAGPEDNLAPAGDHRRIVKGFAALAVPPFKTAEHDIELGWQPFEQFRDRLVLGGEKGLALEKILGRIAGHHQFGKDHQLAAGPAGFSGPLHYLAAIFGKITDNRIYLNKGNFHLLLPGWHCNKIFALPFKLIGTYLPLSPFFFR